MNGSQNPPRTFLFHPSIDVKWERLRGGETNIRGPSLGLQYLMAILRKGGYPYSFRDQTIQKISYDQLAEEVHDGQFSIVGLYSNVMIKEGVLKCIQAIKSRTSARILIGGPGTIEAADYLKAGADAICIGEGERRLLPLLDALASGNGHLSKIGGICYRDGDGSVCSTSPVPIIEDLDTLPIPYRPPELASYYGEPGNPAQKGSYYVSMMTSRGCPYRCTFCSSHEIWNHLVRLRSVDHVLAEVEAILLQWPKAYINFVDDVFGQRASWVDEFCRNVLDRRLRFFWRCDLHPLNFIKQREKIFPLMARTGCNAISFGVQSGSLRILENIQRDGREPAELIETLKLCRKHDILTIITYIFGLPGETHQTIEESIQESLKLEAHIADFHPLAVFPGSAIARVYDKKKFNDLSTMEIEQACAEAFRRFYLRPSKMARLLWLILRKNPGYFLRIFTPAKLLVNKMILEKRQIHHPWAQNPAE